MRAAAIRYPVRSSEGLAARGLVKTFLLMVLAAFAACIIPVQSIVNGRLGQALSHPFLTSWISFLSGTLALTAIVLIVSGGIPPLEEALSQPWYLYTGGILGVVFVTTVLVVVPQIGTANVLAAAIVGQMTMSLIIDHFGVLGIPRQPVNWVKVVGVCFLLLGTVCISRSKAIESMLSSRGDSPYNAPENSGRTP